MTAPLEQRVRFPGGLGELPLLIERLPHARGLPLPSYMTEGAAGLDLVAAIDQEMELPPAQVCLIPTGLRVAVPRGYEAQIRPRSGLALNHAVTLLNSPGTIDSDYRGEVQVIVMNHGRAPFLLRRGDRIAQMVVSPVARVAVEAVASLDPTPRGEGGFGHTGR